MKTQSRGNIKEIKDTKDICMVLEELSYDVNRAFSSTHVIADSIRAGSNPVEYYAESLSLVSDLLDEIYADICELKEVTDDIGDKKRLKQTPYSIREVTEIRELISGMTTEDREACLNYVRFISLNPGTNECKKDIFPGPDESTVNKNT